MTIVQELRVAAADSLSATWKALDNLDGTIIEDMGPVELVELISVLYELKDQLKDAHTQSP